MHTKSLIKRLLKIEKVAIERVYFETAVEEEILVVHVRPLSRETHRCPMCGKRRQGYDSSSKIRRWRSLDFGSERVYIEATSPRVRCPEHGVVVAKVPWARHDSAYTYDFEMAVTWFALHANSAGCCRVFSDKVAYGRFHRTTGTGIA